MLASRLPLISLIWNQTKLGISKITVTFIPCTIFRILRTSAYRSPDDLKIENQYTRLLYFTNVTEAKTFKQNVIQRLHKESIQTHSLKHSHATGRIKCVICFSQCLNISCATSQNWKVQTSTLQLDNTHPVHGKISSSKSKQECALFLLNRSCPQVNINVFVKPRYKAFWSYSNTSNLP